MPSGHLHVHLERVAGLSNDPTKDVYCALAVENHFQCRTARAVSPSADGVYSFNEDLNGLVEAVSDFHLQVYDQLTERTIAHGNFKLDVVLSALGEEIPVRKATLLVR